MKKIISICLATIFCFSIFTGCKKQEPVQEYIPTETPKIEIEDIYTQTATENEIDLAVKEILGYSSYEDFVNSIKDDTNLAVKKENIVLTKEEFKKRWSESNTTDLLVAEELFTILPSAEEFATTINTINKDIDSISEEEIFDYMCRITYLSTRVLVESAFLIEN